MDKGLSRRKFLGAVVAVPAIGALTGPAIVAADYVYPPDSLLQPPPPKVVGKKDALKPWEPLFFDYNDVPALAVKLDDGEIISYTLKCTHLGCTVDVPKGNIKDKQILCPCHGGIFDPLGGNVSGPPPKPLKRLSVTIADGGDIVVQEKGETA
ncbi:Rieske 2Fe-2S domain-containing protein [Heliobacterium undosum]|uniref:Rieske 2Fe-2S domain-containing protein n=1 Tax=Heliomicrobium undosum TaxID=121734 RepID=A0A845L5Y0_9FIRM|nr:ubiquinol-cytochrome c reductase iron-sulfur subunit [Heliomicrobium undosum]MZP29168.1 Rieske 2Fe-2S domain-containing protein [Heliomicrobium undosum]